MDLVNHLLHHTEAEFYYDTEDEFYYDFTSFGFLHEA